MATRIFRQYATEVRDYTVDFTAELDGDTITGTPVWSAVDTGPTIGTTSNTTTTASVFLSGGTAGNGYRIRCTVTTVGGRTLVQQFTLYVRS